MLLWAALAVAAGAMLPLQAAINARLGERAGSPLWAAAISGAVLFAALTCACLAVLRGPPRLGELAAAPA